jgi:hypothetical protein
MRSCGASVIKMDQGFKNSGRIRVGHEKVMESTLTVQNERHQIVGQYHGEAGLKSFLLPLLRLNRRFRALGVSNVGGAHWALAFCSACLTKRVLGFAIIYACIQTFQALHFFDTTAKFQL